MVNKCNAGFVSLEGNWCCPGCGWSNCGCDTCANCGWNRWGCNNGCGCGGVVSVGTTRGRNTGCSKSDDCGSAYVQPRNTDCNKCDDCGGNRSRSRRNRGVGMVWGVKQELDQVFECDSALRSGTLFPELHKPMSGYCPGECNCQTDGQAASFSAWDLRLYLNTHPDDKQALALFRRLCEEAGEPNYATTFLEDGCGASDWGWTDDPWPWERRPCGK